MQKTEHHGASKGSIILHIELLLLITTSGSSARRGIFLCFFLLGQSLLTERGGGKKSFVTFRGKNAELVTSSEARAYLDEPSSVQKQRPLRLQGCVAPGVGGDGAGVVGLVRVLGLFGVLGGNPRPGGPSPGPDSSPCARLQSAIYSATRSCLLRVPTRGSLVAMCVTL